MFGAKMRPVQNMIFLFTSSLQVCAGRVNGAIANDAQMDSKTKAAVVASISKLLMEQYISKA